jgi:hypothetical protein
MYVNENHFFVNAGMIARVCFDGVKKAVRLAAVRLCSAVLRGTALHTWFTCDRCRDPRVHRRRRRRRDRNPDLHRDGR